MSLLTSRGAQPKKTRSANLHPYPSMKQFSCLLLTAALGFLTSTGFASSIPELVDTATDTLANRQGSASPISTEEFKAAKGVAIINIIKAGFIIGGTGGEGVVLLRSKQGISGAFGVSSWSAPIPIILSGGSFGAQIGGTNTKTIVLLNSDQAVKIFTQPGKIAWDAKANGTAGGDSQSEQTGGLLSDQDVKMYQQTNGLYGGATFGGVSLAINDDAIKQSYGNNFFIRDIIEGRVKQPDYAKRLIDLLNGKR